MISLGLLLLSSAPIADDTSIFVDGTHEHAWSEVFETDERRMQFDTNYLSEGKVSEKSYPVALVRVRSSSPEKPETQIRVSISRDARFAIDCKRSAFTPIEAQTWNRAKGDYEILKFPNPVFQALRPEAKGQFGALFRHVCGPDWSMNQNQ